MDVIIDLWTDIASLAIFDTTQAGPSDSHYPTFHENRDVQEGRYALVGLQGDQTFRVRITDGPLTAGEREWINDTLGPLGLVICSGQAYVSGMDLPGEPPEIYEKHGAGSFVSLASGEYNLFVHEMDLVSVSEAQAEELPDYVIELHPRREPFPGVSKEPRFTGGRHMERFLEELSGNSGN